MMAARQGAREEARRRQGRNERAQKLGHGMEGMTTREGAGGGEHVCQRVQNTVGREENLRRVKGVVGSPMECSQKTRNIRGRLGH